MKDHDETEHLLSTEANKERLLEDIFNDEKRQGVKELIDKHTLEKAAFRFYPEDEQWTDRHIFTLGAKWQQEQDKDVYLNGYVDGSRAQAKLMYSEEDMRNAFDSAREFNSLDGVVDIHIVLPMGGDMSDLQPLHFTFEEFIEQFKKKQDETTL